MNRAHDANQALECIRLAHEIGFNNFSIDLIFGTPGLSNEEWERNVQTVIDLKVPHISSYALTVEPKTALQKMIILKKKENVNEDIQATQYGMLMKMLRTPVMSIMKFPILQNLVSEAGTTAVIGKVKNILALGLRHILMMEK